MTPINELGFLVLAVTYVAVMYGLTIPAMRPDPGEPYTLGRWIAATISALVITAAIWCLIMLQSGQWGDY